MATTLIPPGGAVVVEIPRRELDYYASRLLSVGTDHVVELPPQMAEAVRAGDNDTEQHSPKVKFRAWLTEAGVEQVEEVRA